MKPASLAFNCLVVCVCLAVVSAESLNSNEQSNMCSFDTRAYDVFLTGGQVGPPEMLTEEECESKCCGTSECKFMSFNHSVDGQQGECFLWTSVTNVGVVDHTSTRRKLDSAKEAACSYAARLRRVFYGPDGTQLKSETGLITDDECEKMCCEESECVFYSFKYHRYQGEQCVLWSETPSHVDPTDEVDGWSRFKIVEDSQSEGSLLEEEPYCEWDSHTHFSLRRTNATELLKRAYGSEQECKTECCEREECLAFDHGVLPDPVAYGNSIPVCILWSSLSKPLPDKYFSTSSKLH